MDPGSVAALLPPLIGVGFLFGCVPMVIGLGIHTVFHIIKNAV